jgi:hypothetical protein
LINNYKSHYSSHYKEGLCPYKKSKLYKVLNHYKTTRTVLEEIWTDVKSTGRKPCLRKSTVQQLIDQYNAETDGGAARSKTTLSESINALIKKNGLKIMELDINTIGYLNQQ